MSIQLNKLERKKQLDFYMICKTFHDSGVHTEEEAIKCKDKLLKNAKIQSGIALVIGCILSLVFSQAAMTVGLFLAIILIYIWIFTYRGRVYVQRYIDEVLKHPDYKPGAEPVKPA